MAYRPEASHRRRVRDVLFPLTEAIRRTYGARSRDGAYPLGAFYTANISKEKWRHQGGIWYIPPTPDFLDSREVREDIVASFMRSMETGAPVRLSDQLRVTWEPVEPNLAFQLPRSIL